VTEQLTEQSHSNTSSNGFTSGSEQKRMKIAVVGTGISGLSAAWLLNGQHDVTVYEQNDYIGGHSNTVEIDINGQAISVDTGFIVYNPVNYPNLVALFKALDVPTKVSEMSFAASLGDGALEYSGTNLRGLLAQPLNVFRPRFIRMVRDIFRFYKQAPELLGDQSLRDMSLRDFLRANNYSHAFIYDHLMPMGAAIWSSSVEQMLDFPTLAFLRFFDNHGLVQLKDRPEWRTVDGGSREYVQRLTDSFSDRIRTGQPVTRIERHAETNTVICADGTQENYDHIVLACHADQALSLLAEPSSEERDTLGNIRYQANTAVLHTDTSLLPDRKHAWASWNYLGTGKDNQNQLLCVTYLMNLLQGLATDTPVMVTLNPCKEIDPAKIIETYDYDHPLFNIAAMQSQPKLWGLQGKQNTWFCGAYFGSGFHEDGIQAGLAVAEKLGGVKRPWTVPNPSTRVGLCNEGLPLTGLETSPA
jgi:predicted NAD/FAD-binding protein